MEFLIKRLASDIPPPTRQTSGASGFDLHANVDTTVPRGGRVLIPTGIAIAIPCGYEVQIRPRSGLALKHGITVLNTPGTIDADFRGEVKVLLINHGETDFSVQRGDRIAQMIVAKVEMVEFADIGEKELLSSIRGDGGFGSTGVNSDGNS